jgi:hypothetical protein
MKRLILALGLLLLAAAPAWAGACDDPNQIYLTKPVNTTAATTLLVAPGALQQVYVCSFAATEGGTAPVTLKFEYGTGATCGTGTAAMTGTFTPTPGQPLTLGFGGDIMVTPQGQSLCAVITGTSASLQGVITYVVNER